MELTLKRDLEQAEFKKYRGKGYDPTEVDDFLDKMVAKAAKVEAQLIQALEKAKRADGTDPAASEADIEAEVERRVAEQLAAQPAPATAAAVGPSEEEVAAESQRTLVLAQRTADAAVREAREDAAKLIAAAEEQSATLLGDAEARAAAINTEADERAATSQAEVAEEAARERREARQRLAAEVAELEGVREALRSDVNVLERHVEEQRSQLGSTLAELQQILDDPSGFRMAPPPALADPDLPDFSDLEPEVVPVDEQPPAPEPEGDAAEPEVAPVELTEEPEAAAEQEAASEPEAQDPTAEAEPEPEAAATEQAPAEAPPTLSFEEVDHEAPGIDEPEPPAATAEPDDLGPPTAPVSVIDLGIEEKVNLTEGVEDDAFLAELRKAMADDEPLGPRDDQDHPPSGALFEDEDRRGWRFGRRH